MLHLKSDLSILFVEVFLQVLYEQDQVMIYIVLRLIKTLLNLNPKLKNNKSKIEIQ